MYHIVKIEDQYLSREGTLTSNRVDALRVDPVTFRALCSSGLVQTHTYRHADPRLVTVTTRADRAARNVDSTSDPQSAQ